MNAFSRALGNSFIGKALKKIKYAFKRSLSPNSALDMVGLKYLGVYDGHDIPRLVALLKEIKRRGEPAFLHIKTQKGRGYAPAEDHAEYYHGVGKAFKESCNTFSDSVSSAMCNIANKDGKIVAITAGMKTGTGLSEFAKNYPDRFKDVGICEEFAVTYAAGMAAGGYKPYVFIYSTFMQRAYDQIISDVCLQKLPVVLCLDRAGAVGGDGQTHQGAFDISFLRHIPNLKVLAPKDESELSEMLVACSKIGEPVAIRYPNGFCAKLKSVKPFDWKFETLRTGKRLNILAVGARMNKVALDVSEKRADLGIGVINARIIKPLDEAALSEISSLPILTLEENTISGGFGESVSSFYRRNNIDVKLTMLGFKDQFIAHATTERQLELNGLDENSITEAAEQLINAKKPKKRAFFSII